MLALELCLCARGVKKLCSVSQSEGTDGSIGKGTFIPRRSFGHHINVRPRSLLPASLWDCCQLWPFGSLCNYLYCVAHQSSSDAAQDIVFLATQIEKFKDIMIYKYLAGTWQGSLVF